MSVLIIFIQYGNGGFPPRQEEGKVEEAELEAKASGHLDRKDSVKPSLFTDDMIT